eukprot:365318-Chlamydomonas_euryale.AAC.13
MDAVVGERGVSSAIAHAPWPKHAQNQIRQGCALALSLGCSSVEAASPISRQSEGAGVAAMPTTLVMCLCISRACVVASPWIPLEARSMCMPMHGPALTPPPPRPAAPAAAATAAPRGGERPDARLHVQRHTAADRGTAE